MRTILIAVGFAWTFFALALAVAALQTRRDRLDLNLRAIEARHNRDEALARMRHPTTQSRHLHQVHPARHLHVVEDAG